MISRSLQIFLLTIISQFYLATSHAEPTGLTFTYVSRQDDTAFETPRRYTGLVLKQRYPVLGAVETAIKESKIVGRALGVKFSLAKLEIKTSEKASAVINKNIEDTNSRVYILDIPFEDIAELGNSFTGNGAIFLNPRNRENELRGKHCNVALFHTIPSEAMHHDALAQVFKKRNWSNILVLEGQQPRDAMIADVFSESAKKFGLNIVDRRIFKLGNDPRQRDQNNIALLTQGRYDVIFVGDDLGDFGRYVSFQTALPRPVAGSHGLRASGWHWTWERHGAPQLNQRFLRDNTRTMTETDWAAWVSVKTIVEAVVRSKKVDPQSLATIIRQGDFNVDAYKGYPASYRAWNNQLRQPVLLHTHDAVIARAPIDGFLHRTSTLDTLGVDEPLSQCDFASQ
jgi:ABC transporter substrate binding protein (PQQ-dependent alcohol dehydrogenase system)